MGKILKEPGLLRVRDAVTGRFGKINSASVNICSQTFTLGNPDQEKIDFALYPNPNRGNFTIQLESDSLKRIEVFVHDIAGQKVYYNSFDKTHHFNQNIQSNKCFCRNVFVTVIDGDDRTVKKLIVY